MMVWENKVRARKISKGIIVTQLLYCDTTRAVSLDSWQVEIGETYMTIYQMRWEGKWQISILLHQMKERLQSLRAAFPT